MAAKKSTSAAKKPTTAPTRKTAPPTKKGGAASRATTKSGTRTKAVATDVHPHASRSGSAEITRRIADLDDWRGETLAAIRRLLKEVDPEIVEEMKWRGTPTWSRDGIVCTGETYKSVVKMTFAKGASLKDPAGLFNASLEGNVRRAIDLREGDVLREAALKALFRAAIERNVSDKKAAAAKRKAR